MKKERINTKHKNITKNVGSSIARANFGGISKNSRGITLIALIITIIVMLILVGVTVNVAINGGLFDTAKQAASGMQMAQIRERAEVVKATLIAEAQTDSSIILSKQTYKDRLLQEFEGSTAIGNKVIVEDGKYDIIIKNVNLDIEVVEHSDSTEPTSLIDLGYTTSNIEEDGKIYVINVSLNIQRTMTEEEYIALKKEQETEVATDETKKQEFLKYCYEYFGAEEPFTSIDEAMLYNINYSWGYGPFETLEEALQDETLQADWGTTGGITKEQSYYFLLNDLGYYPEVETESMTEQEVINYYYEEEKNNIYRGEYYKYTQNLSVYVEKDGVQELIKSTVNVGTRPRTLAYAIGENGTYEFVVKTKDGEEVARERIQINNITTPNPYVLTKEEAEGVWETDGNGTITGYTGQDTDIIIPVCIGTEHITKIGNRVFYGLSNITSVEMTDEITSIGEYAFYTCRSLESIKLPENITVINSYTFSYCNNLKEVILPSELKTIGDYAFMECVTLKNITIPESVTTIGKVAFCDCESLESIKLPENITVINSSTFARCDNLKEVILPSKLKAINDGAFEECVALKNITIPENVMTIGRRAFCTCKSLESIKLPENITVINFYTFLGCDNLKEVILPSKLKTIDEAAFKGCKIITDIEIPKGVTKIGVSAFKDCTNLKNVTLSEGLETIEYSAFEGCTSLETITIPNSIKNIRYTSVSWGGTRVQPAFYKSTNLTTINFAPGSNPIPEGQPWGAPNENLVVTKLTE